MHEYGHLRVYKSDKLMINLTRYQLHCNKYRETNKQISSEEISVKKNSTVHFTLTLTKTK